MRKRFYQLWFKSIFYKPSWAEYVTSFISLFVVVWGRLAPDSVLLMYVWQLPFWGFAALGLIRTISAPYELWKVERDRADAAEAALNAVRPTVFEARKAQIIDFERQVSEARFEAYSPEVVGRLWKVAKSVVGHLETDGFAVPPINDGNKLQQVLTVWKFAASLKPFLYSRDAAQKASGALAEEAQFYGKRSTEADWIKA